jgi:hypothetical protein
MEHYVYVSKLPKRGKFRSATPGIFLPKPDQPDRRCLSRECQVVDLSAGGAGLELPRAYDLPKRFEFLHGNTRRFCTLACTRDFRIGISYEGTLRRSSVSGGLSRPKSGSSLLSRER